MFVTSIYPVTRLKGLAVEMYRMKRLLNWLETRTLFIQQKTTEKVGLYTNGTLKVTVLKSWTIITLEKEMDKSLSWNVDETGRPTISISVHYSLRNIIYYWVRNEWLCRGSRVRSVEIKSSAYADDTTFFAKDSHSLHRTLKLTGKISRVFLIEIQCWWMWSLLDRRS